MKLRDMEIFAKVVAEGSITAAADALNTPKSTISRHLKALEDDLGVRLLDRTTHRIALTSAGETFLERTHTILEEVESAKQQVNTDTKAIGGKLTICAPTALYDAYLAEHIPEFLQRYPLIELQLLSYDSHLPNDFERIDVLIHIGMPPDTTRVGRPITHLKASYFASPDYIKAQGAPSSLSELDNHRRIEVQRIDDRFQNWKIDKSPGNPKLIPIRVDTAGIARALCRQGAGIAFLPTDLAGKDKLIELFEDEHSKEIPIFALYASRRFLPQRIRACVDFLHEKLMPQGN